MLYKFGVDLIVVFSERFYEAGRFVLLIPVSPALRSNLFAYLQKRREAKRISTAIGAILKGAVLVNRFKKVFLH